MHTPIQNVIVTRKLRQLYPTRKTVIVRIGKPRRVSATEWECAFHISNIGMDEVGFGRGIDALQALIQAIEGSRVFLMKSSYQFSWEGGEEGDACIPRYIPIFYGKAFSERIHKLIDSEIEAFAQSAEKHLTNSQDRPK